MRKGAASAARRTSRTTFDGDSSDPQVAKFDRASGSIRLRASGTTEIDFRYRGRKTEVTVTANPSPNPNELVSLELTPAGPIDLPLGQMMRMQAFATYGDGRRVQVPSERLKWSSRGEIGAGAGTVPRRRGRRRRGGDEGRRRAAERLCHVSRTGTPTAWPSRASTPIRTSSWRSTCDRTLRIAGEGGRAVLTASSPAATWN